MRASRRAALAGTRAETRFAVHPRTLDAGVADRAREATGANPGRTQTREPTGGSPGASARGARQRPGL